ncbi:MAG: hypothetical protein ACRDND_33005 [Streptosporangiaceae bacterium]
MCFRVGNSSDEAAEALAATLVVMASAAGSRYASWPPIAGGVLVFALFAGTGLARGARAPRP